MKKTISEQGRKDKEAHFQSVSALVTIFGLCALVSILFLIRYFGEMPMILWCFGLSVFGLCAYLVVKAIYDFRQKWSIYKDQ